MKKVLSTIAATIILICSISISTAAAEIPTSGTCGDNITWSYNTSTFTLEIKGKGDMPPYTEYAQYPWYALKDSVGILKISDGVTSIGQSAFGHFKYLQSVEMADSVTTIGVGAFYRCPYLVSVKLSGNLKTIDKSAFQLCESLKSVDFPDSVETIGRASFADCAALEKVTLGKGLREIVDDAFNFCKSLKTVNNNSYLILAKGQTYNGFVAFYADTLIHTPPEPILAGVSDTAVFLVPINGYEYRVNDGQWQTDSSFYGLKPETEYKFYQRVSMSLAGVTSESSAALPVKTSESLTYFEQDPEHDGYTGNSLSSLNIDGVKLSPEFSSKITKYTATVPYETVKLNIEATPINDEALIEISGGDVLAAGAANTVTVKCIDNYGNEKIYTIVVTRPAKDGTVSQAPKTESELEKDISDFIEQTNEAADNAIWIILGCVGGAMILSVAAVVVVLIIKKKSN